MSAYMVTDEHITALVCAGLADTPDRRHGPMRWYVHPGTFGDDETDGYARGHVWGNLADVEHRHRVLTDETAEYWGAVLRAENQKSVGHRYADDDIEPVYVFPGRWWFDRQVFTIPELLMALDGYEYQACEDPGWWRSEAKQFCDALRKRLCARVEGYDGAGTWAITVNGKAAR